MQQRLQLLVSNWGYSPVLIRSRPDQHSEWQRTLQVA